MPDLKKMLTLEALSEALPSWLKRATKPEYNADEIDSTLTTNQFVTATDKENWNAKGTYSKPSGGIPKSDLSSLVQTSLEKADSALQSETDPTVPSWAKQTNKPSYTQDEVADGSTYKRVTQTEKNTWNGKQNALTTTQMQAVNSGITSAGVAQISTNQTNILSVEDMVCATEFSSSTAYAVGDMVTYEHKLYKFINAHQGAWSASDVQNYDLTRLEAEDRAALAEEIDAGAKSLVPMTWTNADPFADIHMTKNSDGSITVTATNTAATRIVSLSTNINNYLTVGKRYVLSGCDGGDYFNHYGFALSTSDYTGRIFEANGCEEFTYASEVVNFTLVVRAGESWTKTFKPMICTKAAFGVSQKFVPFGNDPFYQVPINHNMIYRGRNLGATLTDAQHTALSSGNFTDLYLGDYWTKTVTIPAGTYTGGDEQEVTVPAQTNITLKAVIADFDTFYAGYDSSYAGINTHHAAVIVTGFSNVVWNKTNSTAGGYVASLIHKWLVGSALPEIETWFGSAKVLSHQKLLTNAITGDAASGWAWSSQKISLLSENQMYGSKVWGNSKAANGGYEPGEAFKHLNVFNHIDANLLFGNKTIWLRDIASAGWSACLGISGYAYGIGAADAWVAPAALILLS